MRFLATCTPLFFAVSIAAADVQADPATDQNASFDNPFAAAQAERLPHPVVYLDQNNAAQRQENFKETETDPPQATARVPHPVVYDTPQSQPATTDETTTATVEENAAPEYKPVPHPVVYENVDTAPAPSPDEPEAEPAVLPPNPDLDTTDSDASEATTDSRPGELQEAVTAPLPDAPSAAAGPLAKFIEAKKFVSMDEAEWAGVSSVYTAHKFEPFWVSETGTTKVGRTLIQTLKTADEWGLDNNQYRTPQIADESDNNPKLDPETWAELELKLTAAALRYASHARGGRILNPTEQLSSYIDRKPQLIDPAVVLTKLVNADDPSSVLHGLHPHHPQFEKLRQKLLELRAAADQPGFVRVPRGSLLREGVKHPHVALIRQRLEIADVMPDDGTPFDPELFDASVLDAVKKFQKDYGIRVDGLVGNGTRNALNDVNLPDPKTLLANMEQWRWMPDDMGDSYVWVNIPEYKVRFVRNGQVVHEERVIIGKLNQQTPLFSDKIETLYFHPNWHVPESIKVREIYPSLARGGGYVRRQNLRINYNGRPVNPYSMNWAGRDIRRYHVFQPPGPGNVLGVVKFTFPNKHMVYLHDTPTKHLFNSAQRTFSHGCVRVRNPVKLAELIVEEANGMSKQDVENILDGRIEETPVKMDKQLQVHLTYFTAWVDEAGKEHAAKDIYGHEQKIKLALDGRFDKIAVGPDHLAPVKYVPQKQTFTGTTAVEDFFNNLFSGF